MSSTGSSKLTSKKVPPYPPATSVGVRHTKLSRISLYTNGNNMLMKLISRSKHCCPNPNNNWPSQCATPSSYSIPQTNTPTVA